MDVQNWGFDGVLGGTRNHGVTKLPKENVWGENRREPVTESCVVNIYGMGQVTTKKTQKAQSQEESCARVVVKGREFFREGVGSSVGYCCRIK